MKISLQKPIYWLIFDTTKLIRDMDIYIDQIIEASPFTHKEVAAHLYPGNNYPDAALKRVSEGAAKLDSSQIAKLSAMTGLPVGLLFTENKWQRMAAGRKQIFKRQAYTAVYHIDTKITTVLSNNSLFFEDVIGSGSMPVSELLNLIDKIIKENGKI